MNQNIQKDNLEYVYIKELGKRFPMTESIKKALTIEGYDFYSLPLSVKYWMLDPMNIGIYDKDGHIIGFSDDDSEDDYYTEEDLIELEKKRRDYLKKHPQ